MVTNKGFSLVEVLVVLAIIAVLSVASIFGMTLLQRADRDAKRQKAVEDIKVEITRIIIQKGRPPGEDEFTWGNEEILIGDTGIVKVQGITKPKGANCSPTEESDNTGTVYCYKVTEDGYILGVDKESGTVDSGTSEQKYKNMRSN